jgi:hypothetical protein
MANHKAVLPLLSVFCVLAITTQSARSQEKVAPSTVQVHMVITDAAQREDAELPRLQREDVKVKRGRNFLNVTQVIPAQGENNALQLMILIDDTLNTSIGFSGCPTKESWFAARQCPNRAFEL